MWLEQVVLKTLPAYSAPIHCLPSHTYWSSTLMIRINPVVIGCACGWRTVTENISTRWDNRLLRTLN